MVYKPTNITRGHGFLIAPAAPSVMVPNCPGQGPCGKNGIWRK